MDNLRRALLSDAEYLVFMMSRQLPADRGVAAMAKTARRKADALREQAAQQGAISEGLEAAALAMKAK